MALERGKAWLRGLQNRDGGWGAFEREVNQEVYNQILYNDEKNASWRPWRLSIAVATLCNLDPNTYSTSI